MEDYDFEYEQEVVNVFKDRERAGGFREVLGTEMDMAHKYGKQYERLNRMMTRLNPEDRVITEMENFYFHVDSVHRLPQNGIKNLIDIFRRAPRYMYKDPYVFLLGWLYDEEGPQVVRKIIQLTNQTTISEIDVIRYYRLYLSVKNVDLEL